MKVAKLLSSYYFSIRNDEKFIAFYTSVVSSSEGLTDDPVLPRQRRRSGQLDDDDNPHCFATPEDRYYFEVLDNCCGELEKWFDQSDLVTVTSLEAFLLDIANGSSVDFPSFLSHYLSEQEIDQLKAQVFILPSAIQSAFSGSVKQVTSVRTVCDALKQCTQTSHNIPNFSSNKSNSREIFLIASPGHNLPQGYYDLTATEQLVHQSQTDSLDLVTIAKDFASSNTCRVNFLDTSS